MTYLTCKRGVGRCFLLIAPFLLSLCSSPPARDAAIQQLRDELAGSQDAVVFWRNKASERNWVFHYLSVTLAYLSSLHSSLVTCSFTLLHSVRCSSIFFLSDPFVLLFQTWSSLLFTVLMLLLFVAVFLNPSSPFSLFGGSHRRSLHSAAPSPRLPPPDLKIPWS